MTTTKRINIDALGKSLEANRLYTQKELREKLHRMGIVDNQVIAQIMRFTLSHMNDIGDFKYYKNN